MNTPFLCVFLAFILNYLSKMPLAIAMAKAKGGYNNHYPRDQQQQLSGLGKRALGAHLNSFEAFSAFSVSVIIANLSHVDDTKLSFLCITFLLTRLVYLGLYLADLPTLRSTVWMVGMACIITNFCLAIFTS